MAELSHRRSLMVLTMSTMISASAYAQNKPTSNQKPPSKTESRPKPAPISPQERARGEADLEKRYKEIESLKSAVSQLERKLDKSPIHHEFFGHINYTSSTGKVKSADQDKTTDVVASEIKARLGYGYIFGDHVEPFFELESRVYANDIASYSDSESTTDASLGILINLPIADDIYAERKFSYANWIPYVGFLVTSRNVANSRGQESKTKVTKKNTVTKLAMGFRYKLFDFAALNTYVRLSYESDESIAEVSEELGSTTEVLTAELQLLGISLLF